MGYNFVQNTLKLLEKYFQSSPEIHFTSLTTTLIMMKSLILFCFKLNPKLLILEGCLHIARLRYIHDKNSFVKPYAYAEHLIYKMLVG